MDKVNLSQNTKGTLLFALGLAFLLLHMAGLISTSINMLLILGALAVMAYGFLKMDVSHKVLRIFKK